MRLQVLDPSVSFSCGSCTACCDQPWHTLIEPAKAAALHTHDFGRYPQLAGKSFYEACDDPAGRYQLSKGEGTRCLFLDQDGLCIIHKELGPAAKPDMCRQFPFLPSRTWTEDRVSANYGCPSIQNRHGDPLSRQASQVAEVVALGTKPPQPDAPTPLVGTICLRPGECDALFDRAIGFFDPARPADIWSRFAELISLLEGLRIIKAAASTSTSGESLEELLRSNDALPESPTLPEVRAFARPGEAPMPARFLLAATLYPDALPADVGSSMSFLQRLVLIPRLMSLARLSGGYASRLLGRNVCIHQVMGHGVAEDLPAEGNDLLTRWIQSRLWQRSPAGTRLTIIAGVHQLIHDLNAVLFFARAEACRQGLPALTDALVRQALTRVEFHLSNQSRLHDHVLKGWLRGQLSNTALAFQSLRLMCLRRPVAVPVEA